MDDLWVVLPHLGAGGAQKVGLLAAAHFAEQGLKVRVLSLRRDHPVKHVLPKRVEVFDLGPDEVVHPWLTNAEDRAFLSRLRRFTLAQMLKLHRLAVRLAVSASWWLIDRQMYPGRKTCATRLLSYGIASLAGHRYVRLRKIVEQNPPKRVLSLLTKTNVMCCAAVWDLPVHLVVSERNDPRLQRLEPLWNRLRAVFYRRANVVTANTEGVLQALQMMGTWQRLALLPNPLPGGLSLDRSKALQSQRQLEILSVARLVPQKGLDVLIRAFGSLPESIRGAWTLIVVGDGPERQALVDLVAEEGLTEQVSFQGFRSDPVLFMRRSSIFALPSRFEGMPNALLEAMASGLPSVVSDASPGPLEMVRHRIEGLVVPTDDVKAFAEALELLMLDPELRERCGLAAKATLRSLEWDVVEPHWRSVLALPAKA